MPLYTVGHSNRSLADFIELLKSFGIEHLLDIRAIPYSGYNPQFNREDLQRDLQWVGIGYSHNQILAGEPPDRDTMKRAVRCSDRSRHYATWQEGEAYQNELGRVIDHLDELGRVALMCGEKRPDTCHRYLTAATFERRGLTISHIIDVGHDEPHQPSLF